MRCFRKWWIRQRRNAGRIGRNEIDLTLVPCLEQLAIGQAADQSRMNKSSEVHARNMTRGSVEAFEVPDRLLGEREVISEEPAAVLLGKEPVEAPLIIRKRADVQQVDDEQVSRLGALYPDRPGEEVHDRQVDVAHIVGGVVVLNEAARPVIGFDDEVVAWLHPSHHRNIRVPAVVNHVVVVSGCFRSILISLSVIRFCSFVRPLG